AVGGAEVAAAGEAQVAARPEHGHPAPPGHPLDGPAGRAVVDEDDLQVGQPRRGLQRLDALAEPRLLAPGEHDGGDRRTVHASVIGPTAAGLKAATWYGAHSRGS